jgi:hypothetical protein
VQHQPQRRGGAPVAGVDGNWACPTCGNVNFGIRDTCNRCQEPRPQDTSGVDDDEPAAKRGRLV